MQDQIYRKKGDSNVPIVSIVICTHSRIKFLKLAVLSLCNQIVSSDFFEVVIVDNDQHKNKEVEDIVKIASNQINIRYLYE